MKKLLWSDNWWLEGDKAWYIAGEINALFEVNMMTQKCYLLSELPVEELYDFRVYPRCVKFLEKIFCIPDRGSHILIYNLAQKVWSEISIYNPENVRIGIYNFWKEEETLWCVVNGLKQILKIDSITESIKKNWNINIDCKMELSGSTMEGNYIYILSAERPQIYVFEKETGKIHIFKLDNIKDKLHTISYDGDKFWLTGFEKAIYIWDKGKNRVKVLHEFPVKFGTYCIKGVINNNWNNREYNFISNIYLNGNVFLVSKYANQILYIDTNSYMMNLIEIEGEEETPEEVETQLLAHKYLLQYIRENRYLGIYSLKRQKIFELDIYKKIEINKQIYYTSDTIEKLEEMNILRYLKNIYKKIDNVDVSKESKFIPNGEKIYFELIKDMR